uniref:Endonuclease/exonuclease/phosphatase domain-containing protein n=1 Tax=Cafeteria roenbergensis TaxID=33653 RepID=A0A7S0K7L5_CAFRO
MPKRAASDAGDAATPAKAARPAAASPRKRAPAVAYIVPDTVRSIPEAANADAFAANIPPRDAAHQASTFKVMCWNVASLRALVRRGGGFRAWARAELPDVLVLNETKLDDSLVAPPGLPAAESMSDEHQAEAAAAAAAASGDDGAAVEAAAATAAAAAAAPAKRQLSLSWDRKPKAAAGDASAPAPAVAAAAAAAPVSGSASAPAGKTPSRKGRTAKPKPDERFNAHRLFGPDLFAHEVWACTTSRKGYAGVAAFSRTPPIASSTGLGEAELDEEGRVVTLEWEGLAVVGCYTPNSGQTLGRLDFRTTRWDPAFRAHLATLERRRGRVLVVGDLNVAFRDYDVYDPKRMRNKAAGFCDAERANFAAMIAPRSGGDGKQTSPSSAAAAASTAAAAEPAPTAAAAATSDLVDPLTLATDISPSAPGMGFTDTWLSQPGNARAAQWSFFSARADMRSKNKGWRLDYALASERLQPLVSDSYIRANAVGSDHLPIGVEFSRAALQGAP